VAEVTDNAALSRFELVEQGLIVFADYRRAGQVLILPHVEAPPELRGQGTAGRLMQGVLEHARAEGLKVRPLCAYAAAFIRRHGEFQDLLA
jgi:predicted GNAT family acetyltransferase